MVIMDTVQTEDHMADPDRPDFGKKGQETEQDTRSRDAQHEDVNLNVSSENTEPNIATEGSDTDYGIGDNSHHVYENREETAERVSFQETDPPSTEQIAQLTYRRDALERELVRCNSGE